MTNIYNNNICTVWPGGTISLCNVCFTVRMTFLTFTALFWLSIFTFIPNIAKHLLLFGIYSQSSSSATFSAGGSSVGRPAIWTSSLITSSVVILLSMAKKASSRAWKQHVKLCVGNRHVTLCWVQDWISSILILFVSVKRVLGMCLYYGSGDHINTIIN